MAAQTSEPVVHAAAGGPVAPSVDAASLLRPVDHAAITSGFWLERQQLNAAVTMPAGLRELDRAGNLHNFRAAAGIESGGYSGDLPFLDSDVYKWLEAASWELAAGSTDRLDAAARAELEGEVERVIGLIEAAQEEDGYLNTCVQLAPGGKRYADLQWGHELYCAGHLIQAAVAHHRATGRTRLLEVATRLAEHIDATFGLDRLDGVCGHPEVETALVELHRETGDERWLRLAQYFLDRRGRGLLGKGRYGSAYWQDDVPVRDAQEAVGHVVRDLYLLAGVVDVAVERGEQELLAAAVRIFGDAVATKTYLTGGMGAHHTDESFGDPYELPSERAYCETCAAIASVMLCWRLFLATGEAAYVDLAERTLYNGLLAGISLDGLHYLYTNPLHVRDRHAGRAGDQSTERVAWFRCACCPPNIMRLFASLEHYLAATDGDGITLAQYVTGAFGAGEASVSVRTDYPWDGRVEIGVDSPAAEWTLRLRVPSWSAGADVLVNGAPHDVTPVDGWLSLRRCWAPGDEVVCTFDLTPRWTSAHPKVDACRGTVALERGPLVYCLEQADQPDVVLDDVVVDPGRWVDVQERPDLLGGVIALALTGDLRHSPDAAWWPYTPADDTVGSASPPGQPVAERPSVPLVAIPYYARANRRASAMRVWLPLA